MELQLLMATMSKENISDLKLEEKNINIDTLIINQTDNNKILVEGNSKMINFNERGISKSRNRSIENAEGKICIISDDDVIYLKDIYKTIKDSFESDPSADIITFKIETTEGDDFKNYEYEAFYHNKKSILRVSSIEVAFKLDSIISKGIKFDENFGLGSTYISGEENIFLMDCINKGMKIKFIPITIGIHKKETSGRILNEKAIYSKGALFYRLFGIKCTYLNLGFILKKINMIKFNKVKAIYMIYKGSLDYIFKK